MRLTKIICTLGPATSSEEKILELAEAGMGIARINFSHGSQESHRETIHAVKSVREQHDLPIALMLDTKGAEIRTGDVEKPIAIANGQEVIFSHDDVDTKGLTLIRVNHALFADDAKNAERILLDNGALPFDIVSIENGLVRGRALDDGKIGSRRHVNLPGADVSLPAMTESDWSDLQKVAIEENMDFVALSFIRTAAEVEEVVKFLREKGSSMRVITKIETRQSVRNIDEIIDVSDGIMVARGDLGAELPFEKIPATQDMIVAKCRAKGKPVIVATQMLESMIEYPMPTRAEVTDIAHAATTRADTTMLSGETAMGQHPIAAVTTMGKILEETESHLLSEAHKRLATVLGERQALADAAVGMAKTVQSPVIMVLTRSGKTAQAVSMFRSGLPILAFTETEGTRYALQLNHAVIPFRIDFSSDPDQTLEDAIAKAKDAGLIRSGQRIVVISDAKARKGSVYAVALHTIS